MDKTMTNRMEKIPAGALVIISSGAYSDYGVFGVFRAVKEIDPDALRDDWVARHPDQAESFRFNSDGFLSEMTTSGLLEQVPCYEYHLCDYSSVRDMWISQETR
jgi:hypothetical protein